MTTIINCDRNKNLQFADYTTNKKMTSSDWDNDPDEAIFRKYGLPSARKDIPTIKESRFWHSGLVREFCINNGFYTCGDNDEYSDMLCYVEGHNPTPENLYIVAKDILEHSDDDANGNFVISDIMMLLDKKTVCLDFFID